VRDFSTGAAVWEILDAWAQQTGYMLKSRDQVSSLYQRGTGFFMAPQILRMAWTGNGYRLEAWVRVPLYTRIFALGLMPSEVIVNSGGFMAALPRKQAREHVNLLLQTLGVTTIE
jgi:hypothetical protein